MSAAEVTPTAADTYPPCNITDGDGVPDVWDADNSTPAGYWVNPQGIGRMWGDMNGDGRLTSVDALMILQASVGLSAPSSRGGGRGGGE